MARLATIPLLLSLLVGVTPVLAKDKDKKASEAVAPVLLPPGKLTPDSTIKLLTVGSYKSGDSKVGERVNLRVDEDVTDSTGTVLVRKGTPAYGTVTGSRHSGIFGKRGLLDIAINYTTAVDGQKVKLRANKSRAGASNAGASIAATVLVAPVALFIKGSNVTLQEGTPILAYVDDTVAVKSGGSEDPRPQTASGPAKVVVLRNGDKVHGKLAGLADGVYTIVTDSGTLKIKADEVKEIKDSDETPEKK